MNTRQVFLIPAAILAIGQFFLPYLTIETGPFSMAMTGLELNRQIIENGFDWVNNLSNAGGDQAEMVIGSILAFFLIIQSSVIALLGLRYLTHILIRKNRRYNLDLVLVIFFLLINGVTFVLINVSIRQQMSDFDSYAAGVYPSLGFFLGLAALFFVKIFCKENSGSPGNPAATGAEPAN